MQTNKKYESPATSFMRSEARGIGCPLHHDASSGLNGATMALAIDFKVTKAQMDGGEWSRLSSPSSPLLLIPFDAQPRSVDNVGAANVMSALADMKRIPTRKRNRRQKE